MVLYYNKKDRMLDNLYSQLDANTFLQEGFSLGYDEFQKRSEYVRIQNELQRRSFTAQNIQNTALSTIAQANKIQEDYIKATKQALQSWQLKVANQRQLNNQSELITQVMINNYNTNARSLKQAAIQEYENSSEEINRSIGSLYNRVASSAIVAGTGSFGDIANYTEKQLTKKAASTYTGRLNQVNELISTSNKLRTEQDYKTLTSEAQIYLESLRMRDYA